MIRNILVIILLPIHVLAQNVGSSAFTTTQIPISPNASAMGGSQLATFKKDVSQISDNPAFLDSTLSGAATLSYLNYLTNINQAGLAYGQLIDSIGFLSGYLRYFDFGNFTETDEVGNELGDFRVTDYELGLSLTKSYKKRISYGISMKQLFSHAYRSSAYGMGFDFGGYYHSKSQNLAVGVVLNNLGFQFFDFNGANLSWLPVELSAAVTKKFENAPIRLGLQYNHFQTWDLAATDADALENTVKNPITQEVTRPTVNLDNFIRHISTNLVLEPNEKFNVFVAYNFRRRLELATTERPGLVGFSLGVLMKVKRFGIQYTYSNYHLSAGTSHLALVTNINEWYSGKK